MDRSGCTPPGSARRSRCGLMRTSPTVRAPHRWFSQWFSGYAAKRIQRSFHRVRLLGDWPEPIPTTVPVVIYGNHASWWDPLVALAAKPVFFPDREAYAPIDAAMLERSGIFKTPRILRRGAKLGAESDRLPRSSGGNFASPRSSPPGHAARQVRRRPGAPFGLAARNRPPRGPLPKRALCRSPWRSPFGRRANPKSSSTSPLPFVSRQRRPGSPSSRNWRDPWRRRWISLRRHPWRDGRTRSETSSPGRPESAASTISGEPSKPASAGRTINLHHSDR